MKIKTINEQFMTSEQKSEFRKTPIWNGDSIDRYLGKKNNLIDLFYDDNDNLIGIYNHTQMDIITDKKRYIRSTTDLPIVNWSSIDRNKLDYSLDIEDYDE